MNTDPRPLIELVARLGFVDAMSLARIKKELLEAYDRAIFGADPSIRQQAWNNYRRAAEKLATDSRGRLGLTIDTALLWSEAGEPLMFQLELMDAWMDAFNLGLDDAATIIDAAIDPILKPVLQDLGNEEYDEALERLIAIENRADLDDSDRGHLNLAAAYAYQQLLKATPGDQDLLDHLQASLESAATFLAVHPGQTAAFRALADLPR